MVSDVAPAVEPSPQVASLSDPLPEGEGSPTAEEVQIAELQLEVERLGGIVIERNTEIDELKEALSVPAPVPHPVDVDSIPLTAARLFIEEQQRFLRNAHYYKLPKEYSDSEGDQWLVRVDGDGDYQMTVVTCVRGGALVDEAQAGLFRTRDQLADAARQVGMFKQMRINAAAQHNLDLQTVAKERGVKVEDISEEMPFVFAQRSQLIEAEARVRGLELERLELEEAREKRWEQVWRLPSGLAGLSVKA